MTVLVENAKISGSITFIGRSSTGVYHRSFGPGTMCNSGRSRAGIACKPATLDECEKAGAQMYCEKCFRGKPEAFRTFQR